MRWPIFAFLSASWIPAAVTLPGCSSAPSEPWANSESAALSVALQPGLRGLLASSGLVGQPMKGLYFFPGEGGGVNACNYTAKPINPEDLHWNSLPNNRTDIVNRMVATHANVIVMSYWGDAVADSPMTLDATSLPGLLDAASGKPVVIMPAVESAGGADFADNFPTANGQLAPVLLSRIDGLMQLFQGRMSEWAQMYDLTGMPRHAIHLLHVCSNGLTQVYGSSQDDATFAEAFGQVADAVWRKYKVSVGFTLDVVPVGASFVATPAETGAALEEIPAVLAIQGFNTAVWSERAAAACMVAPQCGVYPSTCPPAEDNNLTNFIPLVAAEAGARNWVATGVPVIGDVTPGYDGRLVWRSVGGAAYWGDNADYTYDAWRNSMSMLKGGGIVGATFNTWNGFTEGYAAVPTTEHQSTDLTWLTDFFTPDPRVCDHVEYVMGAARYHVWGAICDRWGQLGAYQSLLGAPDSNEEPSPGSRGQVAYFASGSVLWGANTGARALWGIIGSTYASVGYDASCLGLPTSEEANWGSNGRIVTFEGGTITWTPGDTQGNVTCSRPLP